MLYLFALNLSFTRQMITSEYFREYRNKLGFSNQAKTKSFFSARDIVPTIDYNYIDSLNARLTEIVKKIDELVSIEIQLHHFESFCNENITKVFKTLRANEIIPKLNNQGRRPEEVYFSWMRGFVIAKYFSTALGKIFSVDTEDIDFIGDDDFNNIEAFRRTPKADLQINRRNGERIRIEVQSGFQGINDIKQHKVLEAGKIKLEENTSTIVIHFDLFNGQVAFVQIDEIEDNNVNWITRQQMEGQTVFNIDQNYFRWKLTEKPPLYDELFAE